MNRRQADIAALAVIGGVLAVGLLAAWDVWQTRQTRGGMMGHMDGFGPDPAWYVLGTLLVAGVLGGSYLVVRTTVFGDEANRTAERPPADATDRSEDGETDRGTDTERPREGDSPQHRDLLDVLPEDERRILEPVLDSPGLTQIEVRDRADFSKSKVSQTITDLEKRGLLYRESQGRTYRIYPSDELDDTPEGNHS